MPALHSNGGSSRVAGLPSFTFHTHPNDPSQSDWTSAMDQEVSDLWLLSHSGQTQNISVRGYSIALMTKENHVFNIYAKEDKRSGFLDIACRPLASNAEVKANKSLSAMVAVSTGRRGRAAAPGTTVRAVLRTMEEFGLGCYRLKDGRGLRHWVCVALFAIRGFIKEPRSHDTLPELALSMLREMRDTASSSRRLCRIEEGRWVAMSRHGWASVSLCQDKMKLLGEREGVFGPV
ncbi:hypothetical protein AAE478_009321 [Parahypoxylon ruwenzoriense]